MRRRLGRDVLGRLVQHHEFHAASFKWSAKPLQPGVPAARRADARRACPPSRRRGGRGGGARARRACARCLGDEADLDLAGLRRVGLELPLRADVPAEDEAARAARRRARAPSGTRCRRRRGRRCGRRRAARRPSRRCSTSSMLWSRGLTSPMPSVKTAKARSIGASTTIDVRTDVSAACVVMRPPRLLSTAALKAARIGSRTGRGRRAARRARRGRAGRSAGCRRRRSLTRPASLSTLRCCETAGRLTGSSRRARRRRGALGEALEDRPSRRIAEGRQSGFVSLPYRKHTLTEDGCQPSRGGRLVATRCARHRGVPAGPRALRRPRGDRAGAAGSADRGRVLRGGGRDLRAGGA